MVFFEIQEKPVYKNQNIKNPEAEISVIYYLNKNLFKLYCAGRNYVNSLQQNQPADFKSATGTVNHESDC